jgi:hypothetical protein
MIERRNTMKTEKKQICSHCGKEGAKTKCDHCGVTLCRECTNVEIWGTGAECLSFRYFCKTCKEDPAVNSWDAEGSMPYIPVEEVASCVVKTKEIRRAKPRFILPRPAGFPYPNEESDTVQSSVPAPKKNKKERESKTRIGGLVVGRS